MTASDTLATAAPAGSTSSAAAPAFITGDEVADLVRVHPATVRRWRAEGIGPRFVRAGRLVRYRRADVDAWLSRGAGSQEVAGVVAARGAGA